jgi:hypothetical protein
MTYPIKIVGCIVDVHNITMYKADGDTLIIPQGDGRVRDLVPKLVAALEPTIPVEQRFYMLTADDMMDRNHFAEAEQKMGGVVRFFKMVKSKAKELLEKFVEPIAPMVLGSLEPVKTAPEPVHMVNGEPLEEDLDDFEPVVQEAKSKLPPESERPLTKSAAAVAEIMANAQPSTAKDFSVPDAKGEPETTVIAVLADNTVIPGCEALTMQAQAMSEGVGSGTGMQNFLRRAGMIKRGHSVEDLLKFIQKGELPLADDGSVLVYKLLRRTSKEGVFVDCHSGNVKQRVGSKVHMAEAMVDANRHQDCSHGLHVARRDYLKSFSGDVCVLAKLAPEDVIAVPQYDARKLRAKAYHIIAELTASDCRRVCNNLPMEDQVLLGNAIAGNHVGILEYVEITKSKGGGLNITPVEGAVEGAPALDHNLTGSSLDHLPNPETNPEGCMVDARAIALDTAKPIPAPASTGPSPVAYCAEPSVPATPEVLDLLPKYSPPGHQVMIGSPAASGVDVVQKDDLNTGRLVSAVVPNSTKRPIEVLVDAFKGNRSYASAKALLDYKKQCKKSWTALGVPASLVDELKGFEAGNAAMAKAAESLPKDKPKNDDKHFPILGGDNSGLPAKPVKVKKAAPPKPPAPKKADPVKPIAAAAKVMTAAPEKKMTQQEQMAKLVDIYNRNPDKTNAREIFNFKQKAKKSWEVLGVTDKAFQKKITERAKL